MYQDLAICDNLDVVANLHVGQELARGGGRNLRWLDEIRMEREAFRLLERLSVKIPSVRTRVASLSGGQRQSVAVARATMGTPLGAARQLSVTKSDGGGDLLLLAIGGAVIGGTSLFGGRGSAWSAFLGALVIGSIANGMDLLGHPSDVKFMVTGAVLLLAASVDAISRRGRQAAGRA